MQTLSSRAERAIEQLVSEMAAGDFASIVADGRIGRLSEEELRQAITRYGRTLVPLPANAVSDIDVYPIDDAPGEFAVDVPLWTAEEGRSDLTLKLSVIEAGDVLRFSIRDLRVL